VRLSIGEELLAAQIKAAGLPDPIREYRFAPPRRWRADFAWPDQLLIVEVEGGTWTGGRHSTGSGTEADCEKYNTALCQGWRVLRVTTGQVKSGQALEWVQRLNHTSQEADFKAKEDYQRDHDTQGATLPCTSLGNSRRMGQSRQKKTVERNLEAST
jgi:very-short-patch-repair endonuclease